VLKSVKLYICIYLNKILCLSNQIHTDLKKLKNISLTLFFTAIIVLGFAVPANMPPNGTWYQQFMPNTGSQLLNDIVFLDSMKGFAIFTRNINPDTSSILQTTNGGNNWQILNTFALRRFNRIKFINNMTGFICGGSGSGTPYLYKTIDGGNNWSLVTGVSFGNTLWGDIEVINEDTLWLVDRDALSGGVFRSVNAGINWARIYFGGGSVQPEKIYMLNSRTGFMSTSFRTYKTTNGGFNWQESDVKGFKDIHFADSLTGWKAYNASNQDSNMQKTTNGGINWYRQQLPVGGNISIFSNMGNFEIINKDTLLGVGGAILVGFNEYRAIIYRTTNGGQNWMFQIPDTSFGISGLSYIRFLNQYTGWCYLSNTGIHTTNGGDTTFYIGLQQISNEIPVSFILKQNYPNPFNPKTIIQYEIAKNNSYVKLAVFDITGKEITLLVDEIQNAGIYRTDFSSKYLSSGIYFYRLIVINKKNTKEVYSETKKMLLIK